MAHLGGTFLQTWSHFECSQRLLGIHNDDDGDRRPSNCFDRVNGAQTFVQQLNLPTQNTMQRREEKAEAIFVKLALAIKVLDE